MKLSASNQAIVMAIVLFCFSMPLKAQNTLNVLPEGTSSTLYYDYLMSEFDILVQNRLAEFNEALASPEKQYERQAKLRDIYLDLLGENPERTPLNPVILDTIDRSDLGFNIERLHFQSVPDHHVTANFYVPTSSEGPFPTVLVMPGHYGDGKAADVLQSLCMLLASNNIATLIIDPMGQSERGQVINPATGTIVDNFNSGTTSQSMMDYGSMLVGRSSAAWERWDNVRALDYLYSRTDMVDTSRVGVTGSSGGGGQLLFLISTEYERIDVAAITSWVSNKTHIFKVSGSQAGSHHLYYQGIHNIDQTENMLMFAPKPLIMIAGSDDFIDTAGTHETAAEMFDIYLSLDEADKISYFESPDGHGYTKPKREACVKWFKTWFYDDTSTVEDPEFSLLNRNDLMITEGSSIVDAFQNEKTIPELNVEIADSKADFRTDFWTNNTLDSCLNMVRSLIRLDENDMELTAESVETLDRDNYTVEKIKYLRADNFPLPALIFYPKNVTTPRKLVIYLDGKDKTWLSDDGGYIEQSFLDSGKIVVAIDTRGLGETADYHSDSKYNSDDHRLGIVSMYNGKTLIGQRVEDVMKVLDHLSKEANVDATDVSIVGIERAAAVALHAAALDPRITDVILMNTYDSWLEIVSNAFQSNIMSYVVPRALLYYDLPDLVKAITPGKVSYRESADSKLTKITCRNGSLVPKFTHSIYEYDVINLRTSEIKLSATLHDKSATVSGEGSYDVSTGALDVDIIVTAPDGLTQSVYTVHIPQYVSLEEKEVSTSRMQLEQNFPNPCDENTTIRYHIDQPGHISLDLYDLNGRLVRSILKEKTPGGTHDIHFDTKNLSPGVYFYQLRSPEGVAILKLVKD